MIYTISGKISHKNDNYAIIETGGIGFKVLIGESVSRALSSIGEEVKLFCHFHLREDGASLYGFLNEKDLQVFEMLNSISGIGPKSALGILNIDSIDKILAAIKEGRAELLTRASGVGRKTAERVILELKDKVQSIGSLEMVKTMESDADIRDALINLGYKRAEVDSVIRKLDPSNTKIEDRIKVALNLLRKTHNS